MSTTTPSPATTRAAVPGGAVPDSTDPNSARPAAQPLKRRIAFASYVDENYLPGFLTLLRSLALTNPELCEDFVVLHDDLRPESVARIRALHPRVVLRPVRHEHYAGFVKGDPHNYLVRKAYFILDVFTVRDYDTVITLDTDMVVLDRLDELLRMREGLGAVAQFFHGEDKLNSGLLVIQKEFLTDAFCARIDETGLSGAYELDKHDQGILNALLAGDFVRVDARYNYVKRRLAGNRPVPEDVAVLHYTGRHKPWQGGETGYGPAEEAWHRYDLDDAGVREAFFALPGRKHPELVRHFGRQAVRAGAGLDIAHQLAEALMELGGYQEAADVLGPRHIPAGRARTHALLGNALMACSRYQDAETHLLLASAHPATAPRAHARLAQLRWILHDDEGAARHALAGLTADPTDRMCGILHRRTAPVSGGGRPEQAPPAGLNGRSDPGGTRGGRLAHVAFYMDGQGNAGDKVLPEAVRRCFGDDIGPGAWHSEHVHRHVDDAALERINSQRGLVIGGGGLFIPDTSPNGNSAWQWNVTDEAIRRVEVPVAVFAVGYNTFEGQGYARERFTRSLRTLVEKAAFFGLRNHGSVERVRDLLPPELRAKVVHQPCPTTVARQLVPGWRDPAERDDTVLLNIAFDRAGLRFGHDYGHVLAQLAHAVRRLGEHAEVRYAAHAVTDDTFVTDLRREHGITLPVLPMYDWSTDRILSEYARTRLVIGARGHAGMIPFGVGTPIVSLISHPKLGYFLRDIDRPDWGVSVHERHLGELLTERAGALLERHEATVADVHDRQRLLWRTTEENLAGLRPLLG
ncbi:glycosyltransferase [Streptomyces otsuchiensis]|uniref:glycosyltransferase n=1 Tax=Streptomyces otsuchiensis TaxID=2681388 RepID=UPI0010309C7E|nr:glycosyltransferase [Streptomyces otsuchiensis]